MNNASVVSLENEREELLKKFGLDPESVEEFRCKIKKVSQEEADRFGKEMLEMISKRGFNDNFDKVVEFIYKGANIEFKNEKKSDFALIVCARKNYLKTFIALLKAGADVNQINDYFTTATMASARHGNKEMLKLLIALGADVNARCLDGDTAIMSAKRHDQVECFDILVKASANLNNRNVLNQSLMDIPSTASFDLTMMPTDILPLPSNKSSFEDSQSLLEEAIKKMEMIKK